MKKIFKEGLFCKIFNIIAILMFGVLFYYSLGLTGENSSNIMDEFIYVKKDSVILNGILICVSVLLLYCIGKVSKKLESDRVRNIVLGVVCVLTGLASFYWIYASKAIPVADQLLVCQYAEAFNAGDFSGLNKGAYVARYPQQLGMITLLRVLFSIFGEGNYLAFQYLTAALVPLMVLSGCKIVRILSDNNAKAEVFYLIFSFFCFPMYAYTTFVYGDLISVVFAMLGVWMYLSCIKQFSWICLVLFGLFTGVSVQLRENLLILVIALGIVAIIKLIVVRSRQNLIMLLALVLGVVIMDLAVAGIYHNVRSKDAEPIPAILFIVMGLNDDYQRAGWHNNYEYNTFAASYDDVELATEAGLGDLKMYFDIYRNDPDYMVDFFVRKMNAQWNAPMYQSIAMNAYVEGDQLFPVKNIYEQGALTRCIELHMKIYQMLLYGSILVLLIARRKEITDIEKYVLLVAVFGGFLFSLMWEAKTRYVLPYLFMQIPYMAIGISDIVALIEKKIRKKA